MINQAQQVSGKRMSEVIAEHFPIAHANHAQARDVHDRLGARQTVEGVLMGAAHLKLRDDAVSARDQVRQPIIEIGKGIEQTRWPGRLERIAANPDIILDGAHNPAAMCDPKPEHIQELRQITGNDPVLLTLAGTFNPPPAASATRATSSTAP